MAKRKEHIRRWLAGAGPRLIALALSVGSLCAVFSLMLLTVNTVRIQDSDGMQRTVITALKQPEELIGLAGMELESNDSTRMKNMEDGTVFLSLQRAFPVSVKADGKVFEAEVSSGTVSDMLELAGVRLEKDDFTVPALGTAVREDMDQIEVHRVTYRENTVEKEVPFETQIIDETESTQGKYTHKVMEQKGSDGLNLVTYRQKYVDGGYQSTQVVNTQVLTEMVPEIYHHYKSEAVSPLDAPEGITVENYVPSSYSKVYEMKATGYSSKGGRGASGLGLYYGTFACDPTVIPYGTKVYIASPDGKFVYGWAIATDTGAFIHNNRMQVDLYYETYRESCENGVKYVNVYIP